MAEPHQPGKKGILGRNNCTVKSLDTRKKPDVLGPQEILVKCIFEPLLFADPMLQTSLKTNHELVKRGIFLLLRMRGETEM